MMDKVKKEINKIISRRDNNKGEEISKLERNVSLTKDLGFDSIELADLTVQIEDIYGVDIFEDRIVDKIGEVIDEINKKR